MRKNLFLAAFAVLSISSAQALVVVNGVPGEDADNTSPFETLQAAVDFANDGTETVIEIQTPGPISGATLAGKTLNHPITIQAGSGLLPRITTSLNMTPTTGTQLITLNNLDVNTTGTRIPLRAGTSIIAENCIFNCNPSAGFYYPAVTAAVPGNITTGSINLTSCTLVGHTALQAGRSCRDYVLTRCDVTAVMTDLGPIFGPAISNAMNWRFDYAVRFGVAEGYVEIQEPRTLTLDQCMVRGGMALGWPATTLPDAYYQNENSTIGPVVATNTVFDSLPKDAVAGEANRINYSPLPPNQNASSTFKHCTFRSNNAFGLFYFPGSQQATTISFTNCLFDMMLGNYGIYKLVSGNASTILAGDANAYHVPSGTEIFEGASPTTAAPFETTTHYYIGNTAVAANLTDNYGALLLNHTDVCAKAVATVPLTLTDKDSNPRPMPVAALASDIGADEINESASSKVETWTIY